MCKGGGEGSLDTRVVRTLREEGSKGLEGSSHTGEGARGQGMNLASTGGKEPPG